MSWRNFLGMAATGVTVTAMGSNVLFNQDGSKQDKDSKQDKSSKRKPNMYPVVRITMKETRAYCPFYKLGDIFFIRQQCFDPTTAMPKQFCMHSLNDIYETYRKVRKGPVGNKKIEGCHDKGIVQFDIQRLLSEEGSRLESASGRSLTGEER